MKLPLYILAGVALGWLYRWITTPQQITRRESYELQGRDMVERFRHLQR